jgi:adenosine 3'-phospho 5'-phosphosulfate transporter B3
MGEKSSLAEAPKPPTSKELLSLTAGAVVFFSIHNFLQEAIMKRPGFTFGWALGLLEMIGTCSFSAAERWLRRDAPDNSAASSGGGGGGGGGEGGGGSSSGGGGLVSVVMTWLGKNVLGRPIDAASWCDYLIVAGCLMASSSLSNIALNYINFPTKVVFRSCKLIPTMLIAVVLHRRSFQAAEWGAAFMVCVGLALVGLADVQSFGSDFHPLGLMLVTMSVVADSIMPNIQQRLFSRGEGRADVVFVTNLLVSACMILSLGYSGDLVGALSVAARDSTARLYMIIYASVAYVAVSFHMQIVQRFGGVVGVLVGNGRKIITILFSFIFFPKPVSLNYILGVVCSLGGLTAAVFLREREKRSKAMMKLRSITSLSTIEGTDDNQQQQQQQQQQSSGPELAGNENGEGQRQRGGSAEYHQKKNRQSSFP